jgi:hypothetical protein
MARALVLAVAALAVGCGATDALRGVLDAHMTTEEALALAGGLGAPYTHVRFGLAPRFTGESASGSYALPRGVRRVAITAAAPHALSPRWWLVARGLARRLPR